MYLSGLLVVVAVNSLGTYNDASGEERAVSGVDDTGKSALTALHNIGRARGRVGIMAIKNLLMHCCYILMGSAK